MLSGNSQNDELFTSLIADFNSDGYVDQSDLPAWQAGYGSSNATTAQGDADGDGIVSGRDFLAWQRSFGSISPLAEHGIVSAALLASDVSHTGDGTGFSVAYGAGYQYAPASAQLAGGESVVIWSGQNGASSSGVWGQRLNATGGKVGAVFQINGIGTSGYNPMVASDGDDKFVVVWHNLNTTSGQSQIFAQRYSFSTTAGIQADGTAIHVNSTGTAGLDYYPSVAMLEDESFVVSWRGWSNSTLTNDVYVRRYNADGTPRNGEGPLVASHITSNQMIDNSDRHSIVADDDGFWVLWRSLVAGSGTSILYVRRADVDPHSGQLAWQTPVLVNSQTSKTVYDASLGRDDRGNLLVVWSERAAEQTASSIRARYYQADHPTNPWQAAEFGLAASANFGVLTNVQADSSGRFVIGLTQIPTPGATPPASSTLGAFIQWYNPTLPGTIDDQLTIPLKISTTDLTQDYFTSPALAVGEADQVLIAWAGKEAATASSDIYARRFRPQLSGALLVSTLADEFDGDYRAGDLSLREALWLESTMSGINTIGFATSVFGMTRSIVLADQNGDGIADPLTIGSDVIIQGTGADKLTIQGNGAAHVFDFQAGLAATQLSGVTVKGATLAGIKTAGNVTIRDVEVRDNSGTGISAGVGSVLALSSSTIADNQNGGVTIVSSSATLANVTISGNSSTGVAGGVSVSGASGSATLTNVTISNNRADIDNTGGSRAGGIVATTSSNVTMYNTIIAGNYVGSASSILDLTEINLGNFNTVASSHNLIGTAGNSGIVDSRTSTLGNIVLQGNETLTNVGLLPLSDNGGTSRTHGLAPTSLAIDKGSNIRAQAAISDARDQRDANRYSNFAVGATTDIGAFELAPRVSQTGDFDGDGRNDQLFFDATSNDLSILFDRGGRFESASWGQLPTGGTWSQFKVGEFNGDGRDDLWAYNSVGGWSIAVSDGSVFNIHDLDIPGAWSQTFVGDFDNDGSEELLGRTALTANWQVLQYDDARGAVVETTWGASLQTAGWIISVHDINHDGHDDLVARTATDWRVAVSSGVSLAGDTSWGTWFDGYISPSTGLQVGTKDKYQDILNTFADVYNNVDLEWYHGFMKGINATEDTQAANPWDQAALLVNKLEGLLGAPKAQLVIGRVRASELEVAEWLGVENANIAIFALRELLDGTATEPVAGILEFTHAWVRAEVPGANGLEWIDLDPSWKFRDLQGGISVNFTTPNGTFNELAYLSLDPDNDRRLPIEYYEDLVQQYLVENHPSKSLADVPRDGPIETKVFSVIPAGLGTNGSASAQGAPLVSDNLAAIISNPTLRDQYTHTFKVDVGRTTTEVSSSHPITVTTPSSYGPIDPGPLPSVPNVWPAGLSAGSFASYGGNLDPGPLPAPRDVTFSSITQFDPYNGLDPVPYSYNLDLRSKTFTSYQPWWLDDPYFTEADFPSTFLSHSLQGGSGSGSFQGENLVLTATSGSRIVAKAIAIDKHQITASTHLQFNFSSTNRGALHGIGWANSLTSIVPNVNSQFYNLYTSGSASPTGLFSQIQPVLMQNQSSVSGAFNIGAAFSGSVEAKYLIFFTESEPSGDFAANSTFSDVLLFESPSLYNGNIVHNSSDTTLDLTTGNDYKTLALSGIPNPFTGSGTLNYYPLTPHTVLKFDFQSDREGEVHAIGWDLDSELNAANGNSGNGGRIYQLYGTDQTTYFDHGNDTYSGTGYLPFSIPIGQDVTLAANQYLELKNLVFINEDGLDPLEPLQLHGISRFRNIRFVEEPPAELGVEMTTQQSTTAVKLSATTTQGLVAKTLNIAPYTITPNTVLEFRHSSTSQGVFHGIGWDQNDTYNNGPANLFQIYGTQAGGDPNYRYDGVGVDAIRIPIGAYTGATGNITEITFYLQEGTAAGFANSTFSHIRLLEDRPFGSHSFSSGQLTLTGNAFKTLDVSNYTITPYTALKFNFRSSSQGTFHGIGWDSDSTYDNGSDAALYQVFGTQTNPNGNLYTTGLNTTQTITINLGGNEGDVIDRLIFAIQDAADSNATSFISNVQLFENRESGTATVSGSGSGAELRLTGTAFKTLPIGASVPITQNTVLSFDFLSTVKGTQHGIGLDTNTSYNEGADAQHLISIFGTSGVSIPGYEYTNSLGTWQHFDIPIGLYSAFEGDTFSRLVFFSDDQDITPNVTSWFRNIRIHNDAGTAGNHLTTGVLSVPAHSQDRIEITYDRETGSPPDGQHDHYRASIVVGANNGVGDDTATTNEFFLPYDQVDLTISHYAPTALYAAANLPDVNRVLNFKEEPGELIAVALDANQHSRGSLADLQDVAIDNAAVLISEVKAGTDSEADRVAGIRSLLTYAGAKYWHDFNEHNEVIAGLTRSLSSQQWVGSGIITAKPHLLTYAGSSGNTQIIDHLTYGFAPRDFGVDLPNLNHVFLNGSTGAFQSEAIQLLGLNSSALEHTIVEEMVNSESVSTVKGLQSAFFRDRGLNADNNFISNDAILVFRRVGSTIKYDGEWYQGSSQPNLNQTKTRAEVIAMLAFHRPKTATLPNTVASTIADILDGTSASFSGDLTILVPRGKSIVGNDQDVNNPNNWIGSVYIVESAERRLYAIAKEGGPVTSGGASGNLPSSLSPFFQNGNFTYSSYTGDPVNTANGNMFREDLDFAYANLGVPLSFGRRYDSQNEDDLGLGAGWSYSFGDVLIDDPDNPGDLIWITSSGQRHTFEHITGTQYKTPAALHGVFAGSSGTGYSYKDKSGMEYHFGAVSGTENSLAIRGRLTSQIDNIGNGVVITYDTGTFLRRINQVYDVHDINRRLEFDYNTDGVISEVRKIVGGVNQGAWSYNYTQVTGTDAGSIQRLNYVQAPSVDSVSTSGTVSASRPTTIYTYHTDSSPARGLISSIIEADFQTSHAYEYYPNGRVFRVTDSAGNTETFTYNLFRNITEATDLNGNTETYIHQDNGLTSRQVHADRTRQIFTWGKVDTPAEFLMTSSTDEVGAVEKFTYYIDNASYFDDPASAQVVAAGDFRLRELYKASSKRFLNAAGVVIVGQQGIFDTRFDYFRPSSRLHMINLDEVLVDPGNEDLLTQSFYDSVGRLTAIVDAEGNKTTRTYYSDTVNPPHLRGLLESETNPRGNDTTPTSDPNKEYVVWDILAPSFALTRDTLTVQVSVPNGAQAAGKHVNVDAVRIERISGDYPYSRVIDEDNDGINDEFSTTGTASYFDNGNGYSFYVNGDRILLTTDGSTATWTFKNLEPGTYRVLTTWQADPSRSSAVPYKIYDGTTSSYATIANPPAVDQTAPPNDVSMLYKTVFNYDTAGNVESAATDNIPSGASAYDHHGNVLASVDPTGVGASYVYDALGRRRQASAVSNNGSPNLTTLSEYDASGLLRRITDPLGRVTEFQYDSRDNLVKQINADGSVVTFQYDGVGNRVSATDGLGRTTQFKYDSRNRLVGTVHPDGAIERVRYTGTGQVAATVDGRDNITSFTYDAGGRLKETRDADNKTATNSYDTIGRLQIKGDFKGQSTFYLYDDLSRVIDTIVLPETGATAYLSWISTDYDAAGNVVRTISYDTPKLQADGVPLIASSIRNLIKTHPNYVQVVEARYDSVNRPIERVNADGTFTQTVYDNAGRIRHTYDELGRKTRITYDGYGRVFETILPDPDGTTGPLPSPVTRVEYDAAGNQTAVIDPNGNITRFEYDLLNRVVITLDAEGGRAHSVYDTAGQMVAAIDALGRAAYTLYDNRGRSKMSRAADPDGNGPQLAPETHRKYDKAGNLEEETDSRGYKTSYQYDELNRLVKKTFVVNQVADNSNLSDDISFKVEQGTPTYQPNQTGSVGGDSTKIAGTPTVPARAEWTFKNLDAAIYYIYVTWDPSTGNGGQASSFFNATPVNVSQAAMAGLEFPAFDQAISPSRQTGTNKKYQTLYESGQTTDWLEVHVVDARLMTDGLTLEVALERGANDLLADAIRIERVSEEVFSYDANGNLEYEIDSLGRRTDYTYDALNRMKTVELPNPNVLDPTGAPLPRPKTTTKYDGFGNVVSTEEYRGGQNRQTTATFDKRNRLKTKTLDTGGSEVVTTSYTYDDVGNLTTQIEAVGEFDVTTSYIYDGLNRRTQEIRQPDASTTFINLLGYDANGNITSSFDYVFSNVPRHVAHEERVYDKLNRQTSVIRDADGKLEAITQSTYDAVGNLIRTTDPLDRITESVYDRLNRPVVTISPDPDGLAGPLGSPTLTTTYDIAGNTIAETNGLQESKRWVYDSLGRVIRSIDALGKETVSQYDSEGNLISHVDPEQNVTTYAYDDLNRMTSETITLPGVGNVSRTYKYNREGNLAEKTDRNGRKTEYVYDRLDRKTFEIGKSGLTLTQFFAWRYDDLGRVTFTQDYVASNGTSRFETFVYDKFNRVTIRRNYDPATTLDGTPHIEQRFDYDILPTSGSFFGPADHVQTSYTQHSTTNGTTFTEIGNTTYFTDRLGRASKLVDNAIAGNGIADKAVFFAYDDASQLLEISRTADAGGLRFDTTYKYDGTGRVIEIQHQRPNAQNSPFETINQRAPFTTYSFEYDVASRISHQETNHNGSLPAFSQSIAALEENFIFDKAGQLTSVTPNQGSGAGYVYDDNGNRTIAAESGMGLQFYTPGPYNRIQEDSSYVYTYDNEGNLTRRTPKVGGVPSTETYTQYSWDNRNRLTKVEHYDTGAYTTPQLEEVLDYYYTADNQVVRKREQNFFIEVGPIAPDYETPRFENYVNDGSDRVLQIADGTTLQHRYTHGSVTDLVLFDEAFDQLGQQANLYGLAADHLQTVRAILDQDAEIVQTIEYDPFGKMTEIRDDQGDPAGGGIFGGGSWANTSALLSTVTFAGRFWDDNAQLYQNRARWYDPHTGRFIAEDPAGFADGANLYRYAGNDPVNFRDPSGLSQAGNPLNAMGGAWSGNFVSAAKDAFFSAGQYFGQASNYLGNAIGSGVSKLGSYLAPSQTVATNQEFPIRQYTGMLGATDLSAADLIALGKAMQRGETTLPNRNWASGQLRLVEHGQKLAAEQAADPYYNLRSGYYDEFGWHQTFCMSCHDQSNPNSRLKMDTARYTLDNSWGFFLTSEAIYLATGELAGRGASAARHVNKVDDVARVLTKADDLSRVQTRVFTASADPGDLARYTSQFDTFTEIPITSRFSTATPGNPTLVPVQLTTGQSYEAQRLLQLNVPKNTFTWRPTQADIDSAAFKIIVGDAKYTPSRVPKGTIFDVTQGGLREIKGGTSALDSSYQLRLQTYYSLKNELPYTIETTRPVNSTFQSWLDRWGAKVETPK